MIENRKIKKIRTSSQGFEDKTKTIMNAKIMQQFEELKKQRLEQKAREDEIEKSSC